MLTDDPTGTDVTAMAYVVDALRDHYDDRGQFPRDTAIPGSTTADPDSVGVGDYVPDDRPDPADRWPTTIGRVYGRPRVETTDPSTSTKVTAGGRFASPTTIVRNEPNPTTSTTRRVDDLPDAVRLSVYVANDPTAIRRCLADVADGFTETNGRGYWVDDNETYNEPTTIFDVVVSPSRDAAIVVAAIGVAVDDTDEMSVLVTRSNVDRASLVYRSTPSPTDVRSSP